VAVVDETYHAKMTALKMDKILKKLSDE
jgi:hypothetical protein